MDAFVTRLKSNSRKSSISKTDISVDSLQSKLKSPSFKLKQDLYYNIAKGHEVNPHGKSNNGAASYFKHRSEKLKKQFATTKRSPFEETYIRAWGDLSHLEEWILDSISNGKRIPEQNYSIILNQFNVLTEESGNQLLPQNQNLIGKFISPTVETSQTGHTQQGKNERDGNAPTKRSNANITKTDKGKQDKPMSGEGTLSSKKSRSNSFFLKLMENENHS
ncbi:hypothetical protein BKA69DRAFT_1038964 [Paraphysoderma sedebokerense]|nr:hypothetical protein BKA69DRAFT_1040127 [Paraphysoderma sedebokerense]KAI9140781.1 hypothetical protein BKA69DRAFT_1038964 [Paraphysoderma sedebokerense]